ncbi:MAG: hypothetical protein BWY16_00511 [Candidatus Omnitrophica bacterium ADurb.Bin205]|nr:MAG: hypothetical protein BWY16_00511 [Candidatus Omnitrophica bacterium ADurb.Bin205]
MEQTKRTCFFILCFLIPFTSALAADYQKGDNREDPVPSYRQRLGELVTYEQEEEEFLNEWDSYVKYMPSRGAKSVSGGVSITQAASEYSYDLKVGGELPLQLGVSTKYTGINNTTAVKLPSSLTFVVFGAEVTLPLFNFKNSYFRINLEPSLFGSKWNFRNSNFRFLSQYFIISQPNEFLTLLLGVAVFPDFEDEVCPIIGFIYKPNDKLSFNIVPSNPNITYSVNKKLDIFIEGDMAFGEYEVDKGNLKNTVLKYKETILGLGFQYNINKNMQFLFSGGGVFDRYIKYRDDSGKVSIKNGAYINCQFQIKI